MITVYRVTDNSGRDYTIVADGTNQALDLVSREQGFIDHADQCRENGWEESPFDIVELPPEGAPCYWDNDNGVICYRRPGYQHGDGQIDSDDNPVYLSLGITDSVEDNVYNINALPDVEQ